MAFSSVPLLPQTPKLALTVRTSSNGTGSQTINMPFGEQRVVAFNATTDDTVDHAITIRWSLGNDMAITVTVPALSGTDGSTPTFDLLAAMFDNLPVAASGEPVFDLDGSAASMTVTMAVALASGKSMWFSAVSAVL